MIIYSLRRPVIISCSGDFAVVATRLTPAWQLYGQGLNKGVDVAVTGDNVRRLPQGAFAYFGRFLATNLGDPGCKKKEVDGRNHDDNVRRPRKTEDRIEGGIWAAQPQGFEWHR